MNPNYVAIVKHHLDKLLSACFIALVEEAGWLSLIVIVPKKPAQDLCEFLATQCYNQKDFISFTLY
jgi:hypothetical protein